MVGIGLALVASSSVAVSALAEPPPWAPAHGWRRNKDPKYVGYTGDRWARDYGVIEGYCNRDVIGSVLKPAVGPATDSDPARAVAIVADTVLDTVLDTVVARDIGRQMDERDRACAGHALELANDGHGVGWANERTGVIYVITPGDGGEDNGGCRPFQLSATRGAKSVTTQGRACRGGDGAWQIASAG
jgi:surface antigen